MMSSTPDKEDFTTEIRRDLAGLFFGERELEVDRKEDGAIEALQLYRNTPGRKRDKRHEEELTKKAAKEWFQSVAEVLGTLPKYNHTSTGVPKKRDESFVEVVRDYMLGLSGEGRERFEGVVDKYEKRDESFVEVVRDYMLGLSGEGREKFEEELDKAIKEWSVAVLDAPNILSTSDRMSIDTKTEAAGETETDDCPSNRDTSDDGGVWFFRGQNDADFGFRSSLVRFVDSEGVITKYKVKDFEETMVTAEKKMLTVAHNNGICRGSDELETITLLQHRGVPTRLLDVSSDWKVALYFACESEDSKDGRLFLIKTKTERWENLRSIIRKEQKREGEKPTTNEYKPKLAWEDYKMNELKNGGLDRGRGWVTGVWPVLLPFTDPRMIAQRGFFLVGGIPSTAQRALLYTSISKKCGEAMSTCQCNRSKERRALDVEEMRKVSSLTVNFARTPKELKKLTTSRGASFNRKKSAGWTAIGYSIRVPKEYKRALREILECEGIFQDSIYPPMHKVRRLLNYVVEEAVTPETRISQK